MAKYCVEDTTFSNIADAIREKTGDTAELTPLDMPAAIKGIETGGGSAELPEEAFLLTGDCSTMFSNNKWKWFLDAYKNKITTEKITNTQQMFNYSSEIEELPFDFNFDNTTHRNMSNMFFLCGKLKTIGKIINAYPNNTEQMFKGCSMLRELPEFVNLNMDRIHTYSSAGSKAMFHNCNSLRVIPEELLKQLYNPKAAYYSSTLSDMFNNCYSLDEIRGVSPKSEVTLAYNVLGSTFVECNRVKDIIFDTQEDGTPYVVQWKTQTLDLTRNVGYQPAGVSEANCIEYNSGITKDKAVYSDAQYQALKNDVDWYATAIEYSRYNHDSAVNTINSLPDTSAYLATAGGTNTIKFKGDAGSATDGGAINTLTEAEIAVAAAKGWTVTLA